MRAGRERLGRDGAQHRVDLVVRPGGRDEYPSARISDHSSATYRFGSFRFDGIFSSGQRVRITKRGYVSTTGSPSSRAAQKMARPASTNGPYAGIARDVGEPVGEHARRRLRLAVGVAARRPELGQALRRVEREALGRGHPGRRLRQRPLRRRHVRVEHEPAAVEPGDGGRRPQRADVDAADGHASEAMGDDAQPRWWSMRPAQSLKPATYRCPLCGRHLPAMSGHMLIAPEGDASKRRHAHTVCVVQARREGRLPNRDEWRATQPRAPGCSPGCGGGAPDGRLSSAAGVVEERSGHVRKRHRGRGSGNRVRRRRRRRAGITSAPPVGPLPPGPSSTIVTRRGELVAFALPHRTGGKVWRVARSVDATVLRQVSEGDVGPSVVLVFRATGRGTATVALGLTRGERSHAFESRR